MVDLQDPFDCKDSLTSQSYIIEYFIKMLKEANCVTAMKCLISKDLEIKLAVEDKAFVGWAYQDFFP